MLNNEDNYQYFLDRKLNAFYKFLPININSCENCSNKTLKGQ